LAVGVHHEVGTVRQPDQAHRGHRVASFRRDEWSVEPQGIAPWSCPTRGAGQSSLSGPRCRWSTPPRTPYRSSLGARDAAPPWRAVPVARRPVTATGPHMAPTVLFTGASRRVLHAYCVRKGSV